MADHVENIDDALMSFQFHEVQLKVRKRRTLYFSL